MESAVDDPQELARHVAGLIREVGIEFFRNAVRDVVKERVDALDEEARREAARCKLLKAKGVLYELEPEHDDEKKAKLNHPPKPEGDWFHYSHSITGTVRLPDDLQSTAKSSAYKDRVRIFEYVKSQGFPEKADDTAFCYAFDLAAWLPGELSEDRDPPTYELLPIPDRELTMPEKIAILAAVHDAHCKGDEKVAPWGVSGRGDMPAAEPPGAEPDERGRATWYHLLTLEARAITSADISWARDWVDATTRATAREAAVRNASIEWSRFAGYKELREALRISHNALKVRLIADTKPVTGRIRHKKAKRTSRKIQVVIADLPAEVQARFRPKGNA